VFSVVYENGKATGAPQQISTTASYQEQIYSNHLSDVKTDIFITHNWGRNGANHQKVIMINNALKNGENKLTTWFDEDRMEGDVRSQMVDGINNANVIVVFLTQEYQRKINREDRKDNCNYEFNYAFEKKGNLKMLVVVLEPELLDLKNWHDKFAASLNGQLYVDMTKEPVTDEKIGELKRRIRYAMSLF
jgi:hypothetical protein